MSEQDKITAQIADTLQRIYGDATQTVLDRKAAAAVYNVCVEMGMVPFTTVAAIIAAAGGRVAVPYDLLADPPTEIMRINELDEVVLKVRTPVRPA